LIVNRSVLIKKIMREASLVYVWSREQLPMCIKLLLFAVQLVETWTSWNSRSTENCTRLYIVFSMFSAIVHADSSLWEQTSVGYCRTCRNCRILIPTEWNDHRRFSLCSISSQSVRVAMEFWGTKTVAIDSSEQIERFHRELTRMSETRTESSRMGRLLLNTMRSVLTRSILD
jgi:hypothetical protein